MRRNKIPNKEERKWKRCRGLIGNEPGLAGGFVSFGAASPFGPCTWCFRDFCGCQNRNQSRRLGLAQQRDCRHAHHSVAGMRCGRRLAADLAGTSCTLPAAGGVALELRKRHRKPVVGLPSSACFAEHSTFGRNLHVAEAVGVSAFHERG